MRGEEGMSQGCAGAQGPWARAAQAPAQYTHEALQIIARELGLSASATDAAVLDAIAAAMLATGAAVFCIIMSGVKVVYGRYAVGASPMWGVPINAKLVLPAPPRARSTAGIAHSVSVHADAVHAHAAWSVWCARVLACSRQRRRGCCRRSRA